MPETVALLIVARLTVSSSYGQNVEQPAGEQFDTVQFYLPGSSDVAYRVRTFALDHDIHVHRIGWPADRAHDLARAHLDRVYGQVLASVDTIALSSRPTQDLRDAGITTGEVEVADAGRFAFWNPVGTRYATKSDPAERLGMKEVVYLGGLARFWLPDSWEIEMRKGLGDHRPRHPRPLGQQHPDQRLERLHRRSARSPLVLRQYLWAANGVATRPLTAGVA